MWNNYITKTNEANVDMITNPFCVIRDVEERKKVEMPRDKLST